jgi:hypothetical protein
VACAASFVALSSRSGGATAILVFTAAVGLVWSWLSAVSVKRYKAVSPGQTLTYAVGTINDGLS